MANAKDTTRADASSRAKLDEAVARAQAAALGPARRETPAQRADRLEADRAAVVATHERVRSAQIEAGHGQVLDDAGTYVPRPPETEAERQARIEAGRRAVLERQATIEAAVAAENAHRAKVLGHG